MKKFKKEILEIFLHLTTLPNDSMRGVYKNLLLFLLKYNKFRRFRKKYGPKIAKKILGNVTFDLDIYSRKIKITDNELYEYYILNLRNEIHEPPLTKKLIDLFNTNKSSTFIDIGAHFGFFTLLGGKFLEPEGKLISIEPNDNCFNILQKNISLNRIESVVKSFNLGISDCDGYAKMGGWNDRKTLIADNGNIPLITFDLLCEKENISPDIIKIDVHGAEGNILSGMPKVLKNNVSHLFCELHEDMNGYTSEDIVKILEDSGLYVYEFTDHRSEFGGKIIPISNKFHIDYIDRMIYASRHKVLRS